MSCTAPWSSGPPARPTLAAASCMPAAYRNVQAVFCRTKVIALGVEGINPAFVAQQRHCPACYNLQCTGLVRAQVRRAAHSGLAGTVACLVDPLAVPELTRRYDRNELHAHGLGLQPCGCSSPSTFALCKVPLRQDQSKIEEQLRRAQGTKSDVVLQQSSWPQLRAPFENLQDNNSTAGRRWAPPLLHLLLTMSCKLNWVKLMHVT